MRKWNGYYHISVSTGKPEKCHAQSPDTCPFREDSPHSTSKDELMEEVQRLVKQESGGVLAGMNNKNQEKVFQKFIEQRADEYNKKINEIYSEFKEWEDYMNSKSYDDLSDKEKVEYFEVIHKLNTNLNDLYKEYDDVSNLEEYGSLDLYLSTSLNNTMRDIKMKQYSEDLKTTSDVILNPRVVDFETSYNANDDDYYDLSIIGPPDEDSISETVTYEGDIKTNFGDYIFRVSHSYHMPENPDPSRYYFEKYPVTYDLVGVNIDMGLYRYNFVDKKNPEKGIDEETAQKIIDYISDNSNDFSGGEYHDCTEYGFYSPFAMGEGCYGSHESHEYYMKIWNN